MITAPGAPAEPVDAIERGLPGVLLEYGYVASDVERIERLPMRIKNLNYRVRAGGREWVVKCHDSPIAASRLALPQRFELALSDAGYPVAEIRRTTSGRTVVERDGRAFTLHAWVDGQQLSLDTRDEHLARHPRLVEDLGAAVGGLHRVGAALAAGDDASSVDTASLLQGPRRTTRSIRQGRPPALFKASRLRLRAEKTPFDVWILRTLPGLYREARELADARLTDRLRASDVVLAHNDLNWENLVFGPSLGLAAVLDFDNVTWLPRELEVGAAAAVLVGPDPARLNRFLGAYEAASGARADPHPVNIGMHWKCTRSMLWSIDSYLSGRVARPEVVERWCRHLHDCLGQLPAL